jgi:hypothetical protein
LIASWQLVANNHLGTFLKSPQLQLLCQKYEAQSLTEIHPSLVNTDRISALIYKQSIALYPEGQDLNGLLYERQRSLELQVYYIHI